MGVQLRQRAEGRVTVASLRRIPFFHEVPESVLVPLAATGNRQTLGHGNMLWEPEDEIEAVFVLATGVVRLYRLRDDGAEATVALLDRGQICGLAGLDAAFAPTTVAQALFNETVVYRIPRRPFTDFLLANPAVALRALAEACRRVQDAYDLLVLPDARARVAYVLAHLATATDERTVWVTREELATLAGVSREAIIRCVLPDLQGHGLIGYEEHQRGIRVRDRAGLLGLPRRSM